MGPRAVRAVSTNLAWEGAVNGWGFSPFDVLSVVDYGDCPFDHGRPADIPEQIYRYAKDILAQDVALLTFGGDHFTTYPLLRAYSERYGPISLVHFDAHSDTWADNDGRIDHATMFYHAAQKNMVVPNRSVQVGLRTHNPDTLGFNVISAAQVHDSKGRAIAADVKRIVGECPVYLTFDIDCLDPSVAPGTGTPVVGGLSAHQAITILQGLEGINLIGMDIVEVAPAYDVSEITALAAATIALNQLCIFAKSLAARKG